MPRVRPETIYEPLAPLIADARKRGLSDDEIYERIERAKGLAVEHGYSGGEIARGLQSEAITGEHRAKSFFRGIAEGLTLGFYVPEFLKQKPSEIEQGIPIGVGELSPEAAGEFAGSVVPFTGALKAARPVVGALTRRTLGTGMVGRVAEEAGTVAAASGAIEGLAAEGGDVATGTAVGGGVGGALGIAREILLRRARLKVPPSRVVESEIVEPGARVVPREARTRRMLPAGENREGFVERPRGPIDPKALSGSQPAKALPAARLDTGTEALAVRDFKALPKEPVQPGLSFEPQEPLQQALFTKRVADDIARDVTKVRAPKGKSPEPPASGTPAPKPTPTPPAPEGYRVTATFGKARWSSERTSEAEVESLIESVKQKVGPVVAKQMEFKVERLGALKAKPLAKPAIEITQTKKVEPTVDVEVASGLRPERKAPKGQQVRLPEEVNIPSVAEQLDQKGWIFKVDHLQKNTPYTLIGDGGQMKRFRKLSDVLDFAESLSDDVRASTFAKGIRGKKLSPQEQAALTSARGRRRVAEQPLSVDADPRLQQQPPKPDPVPPHTLGGPGAQLSLPLWLDHVIRAKGLGDKEGTKFATAVNNLVGQYGPAFELELKTAFDRPRMMSWNPMDFIGQPTTAQNALVNTAAKETAAVEMAWDFEAKKWAEYFSKHFAHLSDEEASAAARLVEGEIRPGAASQRVRDAAAAWRTAMEDFAQRLGLPEWAEYLTRLTDMQAVFEQWKPHILAARRFEDLSETMQFKIGSEGVFDTMRKSFEKQDKWDMLPRDVRGWFRERLLSWDIGKSWEAIPDFVRSRVPKEVFDRFLLPRTGGLPYERDIRKSFQAYMPIALKKLHVDPLLDRWSQVANQLPGSATHSLSEGAYLRAYLTRFEGKESVGIDRLVDGVVKTIENTLGRALADPNLASRLASRSASWTYRGALGVDSAVINSTQAINTWAASGSTPFLKGLGRFLAGEGKSRPEVGVLREFSDIYTKGEFIGAESRVGGKTLRRLEEIDDKVTKLALSPMALTENVNRGTAFLAGMEEAAGMGLDATRALQMGFARASRVVPNLELTRAQVNSIFRVAQTQFAYSPAFRTPYLAGPLARMSTIFWSYPTRQLQFATNGVADGLQSVLKQPSFENSSRLLRFSALLGLMVGGATLGAKIGLNLENTYGMRGMFPRAFAGPIGLVVQGYNLATTGKPVAQRDIDRAWNDGLTVLVPQYRYGRKVAQSVEAAERGFRTDELGRQTYRTTPYGELMRALGVDYGQAYKERVAVRSILEENAQRLDERKAALHSAIEQGDFKLAEHYNERYPEAPLTERDLQAEMKLRMTPLVERTGPLYLRQQAIEELEAPSSGRETGLRP